MNPTDVDSLGELPVLLPGERQQALPLDRTRPGEARHAGRSVPVRLSAGRVASLRALGLAAGADLSTTLLAAFQALLARLARREKVRAGMLVSGRGRLEAEGLTGSFANTLVIPADLSGDPSFRELLARVRRSRPAAAPRLRGLETAVLEVDTRAAPFDLELALAEEGDEVAGALRYRADLFAPVAVQRLAGHFAALLARMAAEPDRPLSELPVLTEAERHQIVVEWAGPQVARESRSAAALFEEQVERTPGAVAVTFAGRSLSYSALNRWANRLAHWLRRQGVGPETPVAICLERSFAMMAALVGVLKAGGAYLPIDPRTPPERRAFMLDECGAEVLLTQERWAGELGRPGLRTLCLDAGEDAVAGEDAENPGVAVDPESTIALFYTSGSTGQPKATVERAAGMLNTCLWFRESGRITESTGVLIIADFSFDVFFKNAFTPLLAGGRVVLANPGPYDPAELWAAIRDDKATVVNGVASVLFPVLEIAAADGYASLESLEMIQLGGEATAWPRLRPWIASGHCRCAFGNAYGPSECSDTVSLHMAPWEEIERQDALPIGRPADNVRMTVVDAAFQPQPIGAPGELCIAGECVARGYFGRPDLTAEKFVPDPFHPGERMYRTGDLGRWRSDGRLEYLGRIDHLLKIRGLRVEPTEVEAALAGHPAVREAAVLAWEDGTGDKRLVAYLVPEEGIASPTEGELRRFLRGRLAEAMIPSAFVAIPAVPRTERGKLDRKALPAPDFATAVDRRALARPERGEGEEWGAPEPAAPRNPVEELLRGIWAEVLGLRQVEAGESFLDLGGHSLQAIRLLSRVRAVFGVDVPVTALLEAPDLAGFAARVEQSLAEGRPAGEPLPPIPAAAPDGRGAPLSSAQRRLWFLDRLAPGSPAHNIPLVLDLAGRLDPAVLARSLGEIAARQEALRTTLDADADGEPVQIIARATPPATLRLPFADLCGLPPARREEERDRLTRAEARRPFELAPGTREPLWRVVLLRTDAAAHRLLATFHHALFDGESMPVLERELSALYPAFLAGRSAPLPPLTVQPAAVAAWQRRRLTPDVLAPHLAYFREQLAGAPTALDLPVDHPRRAARTWLGVSGALALPAALDGPLRELARSAGATVFMTLLAAWVALLRRVTGQDDIVTGSVFAHRDRPELEDLIGFFVNTLPLRAARPGDPSFLDLLGAVRAGALGLYLHQDLPLEHLLAELRPEREGGGTPLFQAFLALHANRGPRELAPGLSMRWREEDTGAAQFDLLLDLEERPEGIAGRLTGSADLFEPATVQRLARGWETLLAGALEQPEARLSDLPLLGEAERHTLLAEWGQAPDSPVWSGSVPARIAALAAAAPGAVAVLPAGPGEPPLTYGELASRAERLARRLRAHSIGRGGLAGVYAERTPETLVGMLAVLLAGGAFLPLDPAFPPERLALILEDARVPVLLARRALAATLPDGGAEVVFLDAIDEPLAGAADPPDRLETKLPEIDPGDLAYVIYTSGSTGRPKGVLIPHRGFLWAVEALARKTRIGPESRVLQTASASFDASVWETWSALISGATLVLARREDLLPGPPLLAALRERGITSVFLPPSSLAAMPEGASRDLSGLRSLVVGGDASSPDLVARWAPGRRLWNAYGPTEASICATMALLGPPLGDDGRTPIGRPIADNRLLVLGRRFEIVPPGVTGELHLGGRGLAHGYLGRPDLTAGAFLPDPFAGEAGARIYRTGDLARFRPDGQLEFLGRADRQVKVRGFRIEPGEVEAQIAEHPGVREAAVVAYEAAPRDVRLAAYVVPAESTALSAGELRAFLRARLPEHMVPSSFRFLAALPLAPSGKVDRRALPPPAEDEAASANGNGPAAPRTPAEELLAGIWGEVLGRAEVAAGDDFFDLGGHSLLVGQVVARVRTAFGVELPVRAAFEARTLAALARRIEEGLREDAPPRPPRPPLLRASRMEAAPLSFAQQRLWFLDRLQPGSPVYNLLVGFRLTGALDPGALERGLDEVFRRHEALRTTFAESPDGEPRQVVAPFHPAGLPRVDLAALPAAAARAEAGRLAAREARRPFDLARGPVARVHLLRLGAREHDLLFACHHIAFDGWSVGVLRRELGALYSAFGAGEPSPLPELEVQYADFAVWQRLWLSGALVDAQLATWRQRLAGAPAALELPADRRRPPVQSFRGALLTLPFPARLAAGLHGLARSEGSTLFMTTLAAFSALLARWSGQTDLVVGSPVANRTEAGIEDLIGFFVNTLALRIDLAGDPAFRTLLGRVRESSLSAYANQDLPFERLVEELQPERDLSRSPLFQVMLALDPRRGGELAPGLGCEALRIDTGTAKLDLALFLEQEAAGTAAVLEHATDLFDASTVARLGRSLLTLLSGLVEQGSGLRVSDLPLLGEGERWQILGEWNEWGEWNEHSGRTAAEPCLHDLVAAQVERTPSAVALIAGGERLTYRDLGERSGRLARRLAALGVGPEVRVGVCLSRSPDLAVALLGILAAGGAYVPLDPNYPQERLGFMLEDAGAAVLLTETALAPRLPASRARVLVLDATAEDDSVEAEPARPLPGNLAYLIYTSGSTGRPKAVAIEHRSAVAFVRWAHEEFTPAELAAVLAVTSISFDLSVFELFVPLACGGRVVLVENALALADLPGLQIPGEITLINTVPSAIAALAELGRALPAGVRSVNLAGEPLKGSLAQALYAGGAEKVRNLYGPSEDTTYSTFETVERGSRREPAIGRPIAGTRARLLDADLRPVPVGVPGEIYLGGAGLARGYLGRPELTAERFVPDPLGTRETGDRLYRTGDLGRHLPDGRIEYQGRLDHQVKVRGFRIEPGEIEAALEAHPGVREAVVVARGEPGGDRSLAAYVVAAAQPAPASSALRDHLRGRLAELMIPSSFTWLERLPLTPNGKVDRKALPAPESGTVEPGVPAALGPIDPLVELLAGIWAEVLEREELPGPHDNFFELGGHSLLATRVISRIRTALGIELPLRAIFAAPTVAGLAAVLRTHQGTAATPPDPIEPAADRSDLPLSFAQQRLWLLDRLEPGTAVYNLPLAYRIDGPFGLVAAAHLERALGEVLRRHEVLRTTFAVAGESGEPRLAVAPPRRFSLPRVDLSGLPGPEQEAEARRLTLEEAARPFDLAAGPLFRAALLASLASTGEPRLLITMHHIATDGWSVDIFLRELSTLYRAFAAGLPSPLPELPIQYADFAAWQRRRLAGPVLEAQLDYWRRQLAGAPEALDLPTDRPRPAVETSRGAHLVRTLSPALVAAARAFSRRRGATLFMTLLAGFAAQLHRVTGEEDLLLGSPVANRNRAEIEGLLGFFVNSLVLRTDLSGEPGLDLLTARVREAALGAYAHQDLPFERLVEELRPQRSLARSPLFQVQFVLGVGEGGREIAPELQLVPLPLENGTAKYDLTLGLDHFEGGLRATLEYRTDLFEAATMIRWLGHFETLLAAALARPEEPVAVLPLLGAAESQLLLHEWNDSATDFPNGLLHHLFERQARATPDATALVAGDARLTYIELDAAAGRLARSLRLRGVGPEVRVGVCLDRTADLVIALLAVLKAGGAYVPIDPRYPEERRNLLLADSGAAVVLTRTALLPLLAGGTAEPVCLDEETSPPGNGGNGRAATAFSLGGGAPLPGAGGAMGEGTGVRSSGGEPPPAPTSPRSLAYLIYTSGSTGRPKGVAIEHRSAVALVHWARSVFPPADLASVLAATSICFDLSVFELFVPLSCGGSIRLVEDALALTGGGFEGLTLINTVPSALAELVHANAIPTSVRTVNLAGEPLPRALVDRIYALGGGERRERVERVLNLYGPSEDTTYSTWAAIPRAERAARMPPSIGRPVAGTRAWLVDRRLAPVPLGVPGEVLLSGAGLARGYLGRPELTAERFLPDPFAAEPGSRVYRTGDLGRYREDGEIDFLGRIDHQVKVRGFRIELGEVEAALAAHPAVERAVVATHAYGQGDVRLVAWVAPRAGETVAALEPGALRAWLGARLPEFMVPAAVVALAALPLTPNGKVDRRALPPPAASDRPASTPTAAGEPPRSPLEELVAGLWAELLGGPLPGLHDDFFAAGGHSLLATRLLARLHATTGVSLPLRDLFAHPTVATLAAAIEHALRAPDAPSLPPIEPAVVSGRGGEAPASAAQERLWLFHQLDPGGAVLNVPHPLRLLGPLRPAGLAACLTEIARRHASLRTSLAYGEAGLRQRIAPPRDLVLPLADLGALPPPRRAEEARRLTEEEAREPFDLAAGPLWRARLLRLGDEEHRLLATFHHTIVDGWSLDLFDRELAARNPSAEGAAGTPLSEPGLQLADVAGGQRRWLTEEALAPQLAYWRRQLAGMPPALDLPTDRPRPPRQSFRGAARTLPLPPELSAAVKALGHREGSTLFMTALAAFAALLGRYTGRADVVVGSPAANRHRPGTGELIGFFVGNLVLRLDLGGDPTFRELLRRAREVALGAYAHPDLPFERLVDELSPVRDKSRNPLTQVLLTVMATPGEPLRLGGRLSVTPVEVHTATSQFDLTLFVLDGPRGLTLVAEYSTALFAGTTIERLLTHVSLLLAAVAADPELRLSALPPEIAPRPAAAQGAAEKSTGSEETAEDDRTRRQALLAERRSRLAGASKELLESRLRRKP